MPERRLPDQEARDRIRADLGACMLVEAAAGTGKTTCLLDRMAGLLGAGVCSVRTLAAVTFTRKAAAELRSRFQVRLEQAARGSTGEERGRLDDAVANLQRCFLGTIHSFCARLLRERPVEAELDPAFTEIDDETDFRLRQEAWDAFSQSLHAADDPLLAELADLGLEMEHLRESFLVFADYPDVEEWPAPTAEAPDTRAVLPEISGYVAHMESIRRSFPAERGNDRLMSRYEGIGRALRNTDLESAAEVARLVESFLPDPGTVQKNWPGGKEQGKAENDRWRSFRERVAAPFAASWREARYPVVLRALRRARERYDGLRAASGRLNYQDLLLRCARLLRENPHVRRDFRLRFTHLLVDEFQDTDPVQAEVMFLLTATDVAERDWRRCRPAAGSLFVVGDPKQSIYRFRRADIVTYNTARDLILRGGGCVVSLEASFRAARPILEWVNASFGPRFPGRPTDVSPAYVPLVPGKGDTGGAVRALRIPADRTNAGQIGEYEADLLARTIRRALDEGTSPGDFLVLARGKKRLSIYARHMERLGVPYQVTGGNALNENEELSLLAACLRTIARPDDPVALLAVLRGGLFGASDEALYEFHRAGGRFGWTTPVPEDLPEEHAGLFLEAFSRLSRYAFFLASLPAAAAIEKIAADLGLVARACARPGGNAEAGALGKAFELLRRRAADPATTADLADFAESLVDETQAHDGFPARAHDRPAVRIMNLHKAKGLEAPVVFLADPCGEWNPPTRLHVDRSGDRVLGYLAVDRRIGENRRERLAEPAGWDVREAREREFEAAEGVRLLYVAATRAGRELVVSQRESGNSRNPWSPLDENLREAAPLPDPGEVTPVVPAGAAITAEEAARARGEPDLRRGSICAPTYDTVAARELSPGRPVPTGSGEEHGTEWGAVIHALLQAAMEGAAVPPEEAARTALREQDLPEERAAEAIEIVASVTRSEIWKRAASSERCLLEAPFQLVRSEERPTVVRGVVDLAFREKAGWVIVDYKTDERAGHLPQVRTYAQAWESITGEKVAEIGVYHVRSGLYEKEAP